MLSRILTKLGMKKATKPTPAPIPRAPTIQPSAPWPRHHGPHVTNVQRATAPAPARRTDDSDTGPDFAATMLLYSAASSPAPEPAPSRHCWTPPADTGSCYSSYSSDCGSSDSGSSSGSDSGSSCGCD